MPAIPYALSVHHFINTVGADAGFAAIIGLAVVVLLFFAHARETANLRRRADEAEDRVTRLEAYVDQLSRRGSQQAVPSGQSSGVTVTPPPASAQRAGAVAVAAPAASRSVTPAPAAPPAAALAGAGNHAQPVVGVPAAPAGVAAPALSAATRLIPVPDEGTISIRNNRAAAAAEPVAAGRAAAAVMDPPGPPPSTTAGGANGSSRVPPAPSAGQPAAGQPAAAEASAGQTSASPAGAGQDRVRLRPAAARPAAPPPGATPLSGGVGRRADRGSGSRIGRGAILLASALVVVVVVVGLLVLTNSGGSSKNASAGRSTPTTNSPAAGSTHKSKAKATTATVNPQSVTVAVLNGTSTDKLASDVMSKLTTVGFKQGFVGNASDQTATSTIVSYLPGSRTDALAVARSLKLGPSSVQAVDQSNRAVACNGSATSCSAQVVVTVGTDLATGA